LQRLDYGSVLSYKVNNPSIDLNNCRKIAVFGAGKSGIAVAKKLRAYNIFLTEAKKNLDIKTLRIIKALKIPFEYGGHTEKALERTDIIIVSPGVSLDIPILKRASKRNIPIISEIELAYYFLKKPIIAVTGTNGKTTTTELIGRIFRDYGFKVAIAGNIGFPLISVKDKHLDYIVAEVSSYQLEAIKKFRPFIGIIINITPDHLTRHKTMREYARSKAKIFANQNNKDFLVYNFDDKHVQSISKKAKSIRVPFSQNTALIKGAYLINGSMYFKGKRIINIDDIRIKGAHNIENALAAASAAIICKVPVKSIASTLKNFKGVEHRIEFVRKINGISFYNDSKATNPDSTIVAIKALKPKHEMVLILGGRDKMTSLKDMCSAIKNNVKDVVLIGEARNRFIVNLKKSGYSNIHQAKTFSDAVTRSYKLASDGDAVLLSPACASFDMFSNYEQRGKVFKDIVSNL